MSVEISQFRHTFKDSETHVGETLLPNWMIRLFGVLLSRDERDCCEMGFLSRSVACSFKQRVR